VSVEDNGKSEERSLRVARYRMGLRAELLVATLYTCMGYQIVARRFKTTVGEIDLIAARGKRIAFIEVKRRVVQEDCEAAITPELRTRVRRAAETWLGRNPRFQTYDLGFDLVFVIPWRFPVVIRDAL